MSKRTISVRDWIDETCLSKWLLSWPVAATHKTDSAAPTVLAKRAMMLHAVTCDIATPMDPQVPTT